MPCLSQDHNLLHHFLRLTGFTEMSLIYRLNSYHLLGQLVQRKVHLAKRTLTQDFSNFIEVYCGLRANPLFGVAVLNVVDQFYLNFSFRRNVFVYWLCGFDPLILRRLFQRSVKWILGRDRFNIYRLWKVFSSFRLVAYRPQLIFSLFLDLDFFSATSRLLNLDDGRDFWFAVEVLFSFFQHLLVLVQLNWVFSLQKVEILPFSSAVLAGGLSLFILKLSDYSVLPVLLLYLHGRNLKPVSCGFVLTFISDLVQVVDADVYNRILHLALGLVILYGIKNGLRDVFLIFGQALLAALAWWVRIADTGHGDLLLFVCNELLFYRLHGVGLHPLVRWLIRFVLVSIVVRHHVGLLLTLDSFWVITVSRKLVFNMISFSVAALDWIQALIRILQ